MFVNRRGVALVVVLIATVIIGSVATLIFTRSVNEMRSSAENTTIVQNLLLARGATNVGSSVMVGALRDELQTVVEDRSNNEGWAFGQSISGNTSQPEPVSVAQDLSAVTAALQSKSDALLCTAALAPSGSQATVRLRIYFSPSACGQALPNNIKLPSPRYIVGARRSGDGSNAVQTYALPFVMLSEAVQGVYRRNIVIQGEYRFDVGQANFARWAYWTNRRKSGLYFSDNELMDGPIHSNQYLRYGGSPWFGSQVTVAGCENPTLTDCGSKTAGDYFGETFVPLSSMTPSPLEPCFSGTCPTFANGVDWGADFIPLPTSNARQQTAAQSGGLLFNEPINNLTLFAGDANSNPLSGSGSSWSPNPAPFQYIQVETSGPPQLYRFGPDRNLFRQNTDGTWPTTPIRSNFNGVVFAQGPINSLGGRDRLNFSDPDSAPPALAAFAQMTIANSGAGAAIRVTRDLKYESPPCSNSATRNPDNTVSRATCDNLSAKNVLGVYSQGGELTFGSGDSSTLSNLTAQGVFMSGSSRVGVTNCFSEANPGICTSGPGNQLRILGGLIGETVSGFAGNGGGYQRNITYDQRMLEGVSPPFFPTATGGQVSAVQPLSFGQREQVY